MRSLVAAPGMRGVWVGDEHSGVDSYGSSFTNAEAQAFRRACGGRWGLGLHLWR